MEPIAQIPCKDNAFTAAESVLAGIACSPWSQAQRAACVLLFCGRADRTEHFVPGVWNRRAKARAGLRELEKAGHLCRDDGRVLLIESSFLTPLAEPPAQLDLPAEAGLGSALAEVSRVTEARIEANPGSMGFGPELSRTGFEGSNPPLTHPRMEPETGIENARPVQDRTPCPSQDGQPVLSGTGRDSPARAPGVYAASRPGPPRSSIGSINKIDRFDDRIRPGQDRASPSIWGSGDPHRESVLERLGKNARLRSFRAEFLRGKTPTAMRFRQLLEREPQHAARLLSYAEAKKNPAAYLNLALERIEGR